MDPIEANALFGGRMSLNGSLIVVLQTICRMVSAHRSGWEAGYTQIGSAIASRWGHAFRVRRNDLRLLVGAAPPRRSPAMFLDAPFTHSSWLSVPILWLLSRRWRSPRSYRRPWCRRLAVRSFRPDAAVNRHVDPLDYIPILALGMLCALLGISIMRGVTITEELFRRCVPDLAAPRDRRIGDREPGPGDTGHSVVRARRAGDIF